LVAVGFDDQPGFRPQEVGCESDLFQLDPAVYDWLGKGVGAAEGQHEALDLGAGVRAAWVEVLERLAKPLRAALSAGAREQVVEGAAVEDAELLGAVAGVFELSRREDRGEVEQGPSDRGTRDAAAGAGVGVTKRGTPVDPDPFAGSADLALVVTSTRGPPPSRRPQRIAADLCDRSAPSPQARTAAIQRLSPVRE
jgi:hypothetical protein